LRDENYTLAFHRHIVALQKCEIKRGTELKISKAATEEKRRRKKKVIKTTTEPLNDIITIRNDP
jgi:predicted DNA-binding antitoxin AbrB/MazE fold protein